MHIRFDNVTVAVTGAGHGFGQAIARSFAALGARVFASDLSAGELAETAKAPGTITTDAFDLTAKGAAAGWIRRIEDATGGPIEILISNAGDASDRGSE
jgi:3-oxoacyl-[acyl-carrier protein] reductase